MGHGLVGLQHGKVVRFTFGAKVAHRRTKGAQGAPQPLVDHAVDAFLQTIGHHTAAAGHGAQQVVELAFDCGEVVKNIGVVEFEVVDDGRARAVVHELAAFVEESRVVFVGFDDEQWALGWVCTLRR